MIATGYVGAPRGRANCSDLNICIRELLKVPRGERYELCRSVHAEANAIVSARREDMMDSTMYFVGIQLPKMDYIEKADSCSMCKRLIINAGIKTVIIREDLQNYRTIAVKQWVEEDESVLGQLGY